MFLSLLEYLDISTLWPETLGTFWDASISMPKSTASPEDQRTLRRIAIWIDVANGIIASFTFDEGKEGVASVKKVIAVAIIDYLYNKNTKRSITAAHNPYKSQRLGSYSYTISEGSTTTQQTQKLFDSLPPHIIYLLSIFLKESDDRITSTTVFKELPAIVGERSYADIIVTEYPLAYDRGILGSDL